MDINVMRFTNVVPTADGGALGKEPDFELHLAGYNGTYKFVLDELHERGWDCNGARYESKLVRRYQFSE